MPRNTSAQARGGRLFFVAACGLAAVMALCAAGVLSYASANRWVDHTIEVRRMVHDWRTAVLDAETGTRGYVATADRAFLEPYELGRREERPQADALRALVKDNPAQEQNAEETARDARAIMENLEELVGLVRAGQRERAIAELPESKHFMDAFRGDVARMLAVEELLLRERRSRADARGRLALIGALLLAVASSGTLLAGWRRERGYAAAMAALSADALARLRRLSDLATALANTRTRSQVTDVILEHATSAARADTCTLHVLDDAGVALELIGHRGVAPDLVARIRNVPRSTARPHTLESLETGNAVWAENDADYAALQPALATAEGRRARAFWSIPLMAENRAVGLLGAGYYEPRAFSADERAFFQTLANQCAQGLLRASRMEREDEARQWLSTTLRSIGDAVIATDGEGRVAFMNPVAEALTGWAQSEARGRSLDEVFCIFSEVTRKAVESPVTKVLREGKVVGLANHTVLRSKRGLEIPIDDSGAPIRSEDDRMLGVVLVFRDATQEKRERARSEFLAKAGEALASSLDGEATLATVAGLAVPSIADWCAVEVAEAGSKVPRQFSVAHVDRSKVQLAHELTARYPPDPTAARGIARVIRTGESEFYPEIPDDLVAAAAKDAEHLGLLRELHLESAMTVPLRSSGRTFGAITFVYAQSGRRYTKDDLAFAEDFARRAAMAIENARALKEAKEARETERWLRREAEMGNRAKDEFLATVSHELRTPLNAILGWAVTLRSRKPSADVDRGLSIIERNARAQAKLIDDVLDVSRIISGKLALNVGPTTVGDVVAAAIETVTPAADAKGIVIQSASADPSLTISADADRMQQVVWNLLSNAVKFTPKGGEVSVRAERTGSDVIIRVSDSGEGIRADVLPIIFEPFQQADASTTRRHGGLGLGLAIVKQLVTAHGGSVEATSEGPGKGATFVVRLPARAAVPAVSRPTRTVAPLERTSSAKTGPRIDGLRLLVIDDEEDALALVGEVLRSHGAEVDLAGSATEALERFATVRPDVIVSDIGMPGVDGYSLIRQIRALPPEAGGRTPAVALTAYARAEDAQRAFVAGYQMHVTKPVEPVQLAVVVANLGGRSLEDT